MAKLAKWKKEYIARLESLGNEDLFKEMLEAQQPDGYDGDFSGGARWRALESLRQVHKHLKDWLNEGVDSVSETTLEN